MKRRIFQASLCNCKTCGYNWEDHRFQWFIHHGNTWTPKWPPPTISGFIAQLDRAWHQHREVTGSTPIEILKFSGFSTQLIKARSLLQGWLEIIVKLNCWCSDAILIDFLFVPFFYVGICALNFDRKDCNPWHLYPRSVSRFLLSAKEFVPACKKHVLTNLWRGTICLQA